MGYTWDRSYPQTALTDARALPSVIIFPTFALTQRGRAHGQTLQTSPPSSQPYEDAHFMRARAALPSVSARGNFSREMLTEVVSDMHSVTNTRYPSRKLMRIRNLWLERCASEESSAKCSLQQDLVHESVPQKCDDSHKHIRGENEQITARKLKVPSSLQRHGLYEEMITQEHVRLLRTKLAHETLPGKPTEPFTSYSNMYNTNSMLVPSKRGAYLGLVHERAKKRQHIVVDEEPQRPSIQRIHNERLHSMPKERACYPDCSSTQLEVPNCSASLMAEDCPTGCLSSSSSRGVMELSTSWRLSITSNAYKCSMLECLPSEHAISTAELVHDSIDDAIVQDSHLVHYSDGDELQVPTMLAVTFEQEDVQDEPEDHDEQDNEDELEEMQDILIRSETVSSILGKLMSVTPPPIQSAPITPPITPTDIPRGQTCSPSAMMMSGMTDEWSMPSRCSKQAA